MAIQTAFSGVRAAILAAALLLLSGCSSKQQAPAPTAQSAPAKPAAGREIPITERVHTTNAGDLELIAALKEYIPIVLRTQSTPGLNLAIARRGALIWEAGFGYANAYDRTPQMPETAFHSGSMGKTHTATAIMQLVEQGVLKLEDPINRYLPFKVRNPLGGREITIHDLMTHRSGLRGDAADSQLGTPPPLADVLREKYSLAEQRYRGTTPTWASRPGEKWAYSNIGIATLGLIVQQANPEHLSFSDYIQKHLMDPAGMRYAQYPPVQDQDHIRSDIWQRMSTGYARMGRAWIPTPAIYFGEFPAGGFVASPADHLQLVIAMMHGGSVNGHQLLSSETVKAMLTPQFKDEIGRGEQQGLVWRIKNRGQPNEQFSHGGGHMFGWLTNAVGWPKYDAGMVIGINEWNLPQTSVASWLLVQEFVEAWLDSAASHAEPHAQTADWAWKTSYVRGLVLGSSVNYAIGVPQRISPETARALAKYTVLDPSASAEQTNWNAEAFEQGVADINQVEVDAAAIEAFAKSKRMKVTLEEARQIYRELGGGAGNPHSMAGVLETPE